MQALQSMEKVMRVLDLFSHENPEWGVSEAARALGFPKSTTSWVMSNMAEQRFLRRVDGRRYRLGWRLFELSQTLLDTTEFRTEARRVMEVLADTWKETVQLAVLDGVQAVYVEKVQPTPAVKIELSRVGIRLPAHCTGLGKLLLAYREWGEVAPALANRGLPPVTANTITDMDRLREELSDARERGYAYDKEESVVGLCCVAAPILGEGGDVVAALSISAPAYRFEQRGRAYTKAVLEAARRISQGAPLQIATPQGRLRASSSTA